MNGGSRWTSRIRVRQAMPGRVGFVEKWKRIRIKEVPTISIQMNQENASHTFVLSVVAWTTIIIFWQNFAHGDVCFAQILHRFVVCWQFGWVTLKTVIFNHLIISQTPTYTETWFMNRVLPKTPTLLLEGSKTWTSGCKEKPFSWKRHWQSWQNNARRNL